VKARKGGREVETERIRMYITLYFLYQKVWLSADAFIHFRFKFESHVPDRQSV
jgi:pyrroloquinoline quinone (PQQ) biosynthesis protein C